MGLILGPIVGVAEGRAIAWVKGDIDSTYKLHLSPKNGTPTVHDIDTRYDGIGTVQLDSLTPDTEYTYDLKLPDGTIVYPGGRFATFPTPGSRLEFSFGFFSCHRPIESGSMSMWHRLSDMTHSASRVGQKDSLRFLLPIGDQLYSDQGRDDDPETIEADNNYFKWTDREKLALHYDGRYNDFWQTDAVQNSFARCAPFMIWDDHEILNGWGSDKKHLAHGFPVFDTAEQAYIDHQVLHNPHVADPANQKYYSFKFGTTGFIVLDLRGERLLSRKQMMSEPQWTWLNSTLTDYASNCEIVFIVTSVPFIHLAWYWQQIASVTPWTKKETEDLWNSGNWKKHGIRFAKLLFDVRQAFSQTQVVLLGGDIHVATYASMISTAHPNITIPQFTSSPISNTPTALNAVFQAGVNKPLFASPVPYIGRVHRVYPERNFGVVRVRKDPDSLGRLLPTFEIYSEARDLPVIPYRDGVADPSAPQDV